MEKQSDLHQLSKRQKEALAMALWMGKTSDANATVCASCMKPLLLRAWAIYKRREQLSADRLYHYHCDFNRRLKKCLELQQDNKRGSQSKGYCRKFPHYLFVFLAEISSQTTSSNPKPTSQMRNISQKAQAVVSKKPKFPSSPYYLAWLGLVRSYLALCTKNSTIVKLKKFLGCISLITIKIGNEHIRVRGVCIHYHDLYHLEVAQLERIQMGKNWVSGIHGINSRVFHASPIEEEYDSFLDEARIAIHECLTRPTAFSQVKLLCWMTLLILQGINPFAVLIRHMRSLKKKPEEFLLLPVDHS
ncbi:hypothetical protein ACQFX9_25775 [Aliinostoc sp. HNIBRCY26]|uniref:hypothetical protein n=1 Tax=Aliinostoc sp. HNIBRCY26 TaxID=3418997 RepID=UPI003CFCCC15